MYKGQTTLIVIALSVFVIILLGAFFLIASVKPQSREIDNMYVHNLLLSVLRRNTGIGTPCGTVSETLTCAYTTENRLCGGMTCRSFAESAIPDLMDQVIKDNYDYYIVVQPNDYDTAGGAVLAYGNPDVARKVPSFTANEMIIQHRLRIYLTIAYK